MNTKGKNRSTVRTKRRMREALTVLMKQKPVTNITVREISDLADINRGTFYLHYRSVYDMIMQLENELFETFHETVSAFPLEDGLEGPKEFLEQIFMFLSENSDMAIALLGRNGDMAFVNRLKMLVKDRCFIIWKKSFSALNEDLYETYFAFVSSGCIGVIEGWLNESGGRSPKEMADLMGKIMVGGFSVLGEDI